MTSRHDIEIFEIVSFQAVLWKIMSVSDSQLLEFKGAYPEMANYVCLSS